MKISHLRNLAGMKANTHAINYTPVVANANRESQSSVNKIRTKGKFDSHIEIDDMKIRDRD